MKMRLKMGGVDGSQKLREKMVKIKKSKGYNGTFM